MFIAQSVLTFHLLISPPCPCLLRSVAALKLFARKTYSHSVDQIKK